jgi:hypothetical protein
MQIKKLTGATIAAAAAMMFSTAFVTPSFAADEATIHCDGVNSCKGTSACKSGNHACKGQNSCKGQGFLELSKKECKAAKDAMKKGE